MADLIGLCQTTWSETLFDGTQILSCPTDRFQLLPVAEAISQPDYLTHTSPVATCATGFSQIASGANQLLTCSQSDFAFTSRPALLAATEPDLSGSMNQSQYEGLWLLIFIIGLLMAFGLGAIKGGQR